MLEGSTSVWTWDGGLYHLPHCLGFRSDLLAHRPVEGRSGTACPMARCGKRASRAMFRAVRIRCCSALACGWTATASCRPTACSTLSRTRIRSRRSTTRSFPSRSSTSRGSSSSGIRPTTPSRASSRTTCGSARPGTARRSPQEGRQARQLSGAEGRRHCLARRPVAHQGRQERRSGLCLPRLSRRRRKHRLQVAEGSGYNPVVTGADALLSDAAKKNFQEAYPGDALKNLWHRPPEPSWFGELRGQYADKFKSA